MYPPEEEIYKIKPLTIDGQQHRYHFKNLYNSKPWISSFYLTFYEAKALVLAI